MKAGGLLTDGNRLRCIIKAIHDLSNGSHDALIHGAFTRSAMPGGRIDPAHLKPTVFEIGKPHRSANLPRVTAELLGQLFANRHLIQDVGSLVKRGRIAKQCTF